MPKFVYRAKTSPTDIVEGIIEATNRDEAVTKINQLGYFPLEVKEEKTLPKQNRDFSFSFVKKIKPSHLVVFTRQLSDLLDSGLSVLRAMELIFKQTQDTRLKKIVSELKNIIQDGNSLSGALSRYPDVFDGFYISIVKAGELSGSLSQVLKRLADFNEAQEDINSRVRASLAYPSLIALIGAATVFVLLTFVVPRLELMFTELSQRLPLPTRILINLSSVLSNYWWLIVIIAGLVILYFKKLHKTKEGKLSLDRIKISLPLFGDFIKKSQIAHFARTLGMLLANGVTVIQAMDAVIEVLDNEVLREDIKIILKDINDGTSLTASISKSRYFPEAVVNLIAIGEQSGQPEKSLLKIAESYERQTDRTMKTITSLLEPALILFVGLIVGFIVISMLLPIFQMNLTIR